MKPTVLGLLIATAAFGASTIFLSLQLHDERAQADKLAVETRALNARIAELEKARDERGITGAVSLEDDTSTLGAVPAGSQSEKTGATPDGAASGKNRSPPSEMRRKLLREQTRGHNRRMYADVGATLGLSKEEANKLIELITDQQTESFLSDSGVTDRAESRRLREESSRDNHAEIVDLLGEAKAQSLAEYRTTIPARLSLDYIARELESTGAPLSAEQRKRMLAVMLEETHRIPAPKAADSTSGEGFANAFVAWQNDYNERIVTESRRILNSDQLAGYNEYQQLRKEERENTARPKRKDP